MCAAAPSRRTTPSVAVGGVGPTYQPLEPSVPLITTVVTGVAATFIGGVFPLSLLGELVSIGTPTSTLEELFLRIIRESEAHPGRRVQAPAPTPAP